VKKFSRLFFITLLFSLSLVLAQEPYALHLDKKSGLPSQSVYQIHQDKHGFFWLASEIGRAHV
jgi:ligand-binding sensor domain-containing protein